MRWLKYASCTRHCMASAILSALVVVSLLIGVLVLLRWRFLLSGLRQRDLAQTGARQGQANQAFSYGLHVLGPGGSSLFGSNPPLTGATKVDGAYVLNVGRVQFQIRDRFIRRLQDPDDLKSPYEETCFYLVHNGMPKVEEIATALLHLSNNPSLFDKWALQNGVAFKADGKVFDRCPLIGLR